MRKLLIMMLLASSSICMMGQTRVIKGYVVDKKTGNYLPGAEVIPTGGAESTTTDADGSFSLEVGQYVKSATARYAGMVDKKLKIRNRDLIFRMKKDKGFWFLNFEGGLVVGPANPLPSGLTYEYDYNEYNSVVVNYGLVGGYLSEWGFYGKFTINPWGQEVLPMGSAGVTKRILPWLHVSLGLGVGLGLQYHAHFNSYSKYYFNPLNPELNYYSNSYDGWSRSESKIQVMPEIGAFFKLSKHLLVNVHYGIGISAETSDSYQSTSISDPYFNSSDSYIEQRSSYNSGCLLPAALNHNLSIGIGYIF
jgi:hypothetical protein